MSRQATRHFRGDRLREARGTADLTAEALAREIDVTLRTVQRWERGESQPGGGDLLRLATRLSRKPEWFYMDHGQDLEPAA